MSANPHHPSPYQGCGLRNCQYNKTFLWVLGRAIGLKGPHSSQEKHLALFYHHLSYIVALGVSRMPLAALPEGLEVALLSFREREPDWGAEAEAGPGHWKGGADPGRC